MAESKDDVVVCPCGFFGRHETAGLCSKCYSEHLKRKTAEADGTTAPTDNSSAKSISTEQISQALAKVGQPTPAATAAPENTAEASSSIEDKTQEATKTEDTKDTSAPSATEPSSSNGTKRVREASECESVAEEAGTLQPVQKNKKRCFTCNCKLQPAIREIGKCKCDLVFCQLHRLPEQHGCIYDHKGHGRKEARDKMVSPKKHMGTSLKRIDSDS